MYCPYRVNTGLGELMIHTFVQSSGEQNSFWYGQETDYHSRCSREEQIKREAIVSVILRSQTKSLT